MLPAVGQTTASANPTATAASTALPPRFITSTPTCEAISLTEETIPCFARTGGRDAASEDGIRSTEEIGLNDGGAVISESSSAKLSSKEKVFLVFIISFGILGFEMSVCPVVIADVIVGDVEQNVLRLIGFGPRFFHQLLGLLLRFAEFDDCLKRLDACSRLVSLFRFWPGPPGIVDDLGRTVLLAQR